MIEPTSATGVLLPIGGSWTIAVRVTDVDGNPVDVVPVVTVTLPAGTSATPAVETVATGEYRATYEVGSSGRYVARVVATGYGAADFAAYVTATTAGTGMPDVDAVATYLREGAASWATEDLQDALDAETAAQRSVCGVRAVYPDDLRQALLRRVQVNLAMRQLPLAVLQGDAEMGSTTLPAYDPVVKRYERPFRRLVVG